MTRVLAVGNMYPPHHLGGYELIWRSADEHLRSHGHRVRVLTTDHHERRPEPVAEPPDVHRDLRWYWQDHEFPRLSLRERLALERHNAATLDRHIRELEPQAIAWWAMGGMSLSLIERAHRHRVPSVAVVCDEWVSYAPRVDAWTATWARRRRAAPLAARATGIATEISLSRVDEWLLLSDALRRGAIAAGLDPQRTRVVHRGADDALFAPAPPHDWGWRLLYVGRIDRRKGIDVAVDALARLPQAKLMICGGGDETHRGELEELARARGVADRVELRRVARDQLPAIYAGADAVLFPVRWAEPWGLVPLEAMAVGTPVVATGLGGSGEYLEHERNCLIAEVEGGAEALAAAVGRLAGEPSLRATLREGGLATAARYSERDFNLAVEYSLVTVAGAS